MGFGFILPVLWGLCLGYMEHELAIMKLKEWEGFRGEVYVCPAGGKTVGYGHRVLVGV